MTDGLLSIALRGVVAAGLGRTSVELLVPTMGVPVSRLLARAVNEEPRLERYLALRESGQLRMIVNGRTVEAGEDPTVYGSDSIMLLGAVSGG